MANYSTLISQINAYVKQNGNKLITGQGLQTILDAMVVSLGNGFQFIGVATIETEPGTPDQNVFYLAFGPGTFTNFGGEELLDGEVALFFYNGSWSAVKLDLATKTELSAKQDKATIFPGIYKLKLSFPTGNEIYQFAWQIDELIYTFGYIFNNAVLLFRNNDEDLHFLRYDGDTYVEVVDEGKFYITPVIGNISDVSEPTQIPEEATIINPVIPYYKPESGIPASDMSASVQQDLAKAATAYQKPADGIPASDIKEGVIPDVSDFITRSVNDLLNYYLKSETYTKAEVQALIGAIQSFHYEVYPTIADVTTPANNVLYLIGPTGTGTDKYEEYIWPNAQQGFVKIGDTSIDLSGYVTVEELNLLLALKMDKPSSATEGNLAKFNGSKNPVDSGIPAEKVAQKDGYYKQLTSGATEQIIGRPITVTDGYTEKPLALGADGALNEVSGKVTMNGLAGRVMGWNQLISSLHYQGTASSLYQTIADGFSMVANHKYLFKLSNWNNITGVVMREPDSGSNFTANSIVTPSTSGSGVFQYQGENGASVDTYKSLIDLTLLAPSLAANPNLTAADVEAWLATCKTPKPYYPYNPGQLVGARMLGWTLPKTANLLNPTTGKARLVAYYNPGNTDNQYTVIGLEGLTDAVLTFTPDATGVAETITPDASNHFTISGDGELQIEASAGNLAQVCVLMTWDGSRDEENVPFDETSIEIDSANIYHKSGDVYTQVFDGGVMKATGDSADDVRDEVGYDEATKKCYAKKMIGDVDLGSLDYTYNSSEQNFICSSLSDRHKGNEIISSKYTKSSALGVVWMNNMEFLGFAADGRFALKNTSYSDATIFKTAMSGVHLWYELATPTIYTSNLYYKTGENTYIPLEDVFPIKADGDNWATEALVQQADDANGQPQSITPETTEVFTTDLREALLTLIDEEADNVNLSVLRSNLVAMCTALQSAGVIAGYTISATPTNGVYSFTFTK